VKHIKIPLRYYDVHVLAHTIILQVIIVSLSTTISLGFAMRWQTVEGSILAGAGSRGATSSGTPSSVTSAPLRKLLLAAPQCRPSTLMIR